MSTVGLIGLGVMGAQLTGAVGRTVANDRIERLERQVERLQSREARAAGFLAALANVAPGSVPDSQVRTRVMARIDAQAAEIAVLRQKLQTGRVDERDVVIDKTDTAYPLMPPKLMMSVRNLSGGPLIAYVGDRSHRFAVGQRVDLKVGSCDCYLVLTESVRGVARFRFGCDESQRADAPAEVRSANF